MEKEKICISVKENDDFLDLLGKYPDRNTLVKDYINCRLTPMIFADMDIRDAVGIIYGLVDVEVVETKEEKERRWRNNLSDMKNGYYGENFKKEEVVEYLTQLARDLDFKI